MKTDTLIALLAGGLQPVAPGAVRRRHLTALGWGTLGAALLMVFWLGVRRDIAAAALLPMFWMKLMVLGTLLLGALLLAQRLARPGARPGLAVVVLTVPVAMVWLMAVRILLGAEAADREHLIFGVSWTVCPFYIMGLSVPALVAAVWAMRGLAPTRPVLAGAASGLLAGAIGALVYALHCPEMAAPFFAIWYLLGMLMPAALGAALGPLLLRW